MIDNWINKLGDGDSKIGDVKQFLTKFGQNNMTASHKMFKKVIFQSYLLTNTK